jgi:hypothetical protein
LTRYVAGRVTLATDANSAAPDRLTEFLTEITLARGVEDVAELKNDMQNASSVE